MEISPLKKVFGFLAAAFAVVVLATPASAQESAGSVTGTVRDARSGLPLAGTTVRLVDGEAGVITDANGRYVIFNVPAGPQHLRARHLGYSEAVREVVIKAGSTASVDFSLETSALRIEGVVVTGTRQGQARALQQQRTAVNLTNVVAADQIGRFPDANIGDALKRIPGINVMVDQGEARFGLIRGTEPRFNSVTINGERVPSAEAEVREVQLDLIPSDMVAAVEVSKALTPDMDADAIGGTVNIVTRAAPASRRLSLTLGSGYNALAGKPMLLGSFIYGNRFLDDRVGLILNGSYHDHRLGSDNIEAEWEIGANGEYISDFQVREYEVRRVRRSVGATLDYEFSPTSSIVLRGLYNWRDDWENRYRMRYRLGEPDANGVQEGRLVRQTKGGGAGRPNFMRLEDQRVFSASLSGEHLLGGRAQLTWSGSYARASEERPDERYIQWEVRGVPIGVDLGDPRKPRLSELDAATPDRYGFDAIEVMDEKTWDEDLNGRIDLLLPLGGEGSTLKVGARARFKEKVRDNRFWEATPRSGLEWLSESPLSDRSNPGFLAGPQYRAGPFTTRRFLGELDLRNSSLFELESVPEEYGPANFDADERILAGYAQISHTFGDRLTLLGGVRVEATNVDYRGYEFIEETEALSRTKGSDSYVDVLPGLHLRYDLDDRSLLRLAWTNTLSRPNYYQLVPYRLISLDDNELSMGNPDLNPTRSMNFDASVERYFESVGMVSAGAFYKKIDGFIFEYTRHNEVDPVTGNLFDEISRPENGSDAWLAGFELAFQRQLDFLPGALRGLGIYANYTFTDSKIDGLPIEGREKEELNLPGTSKHTGNLSLSYELNRLSLRSSLNFASSFIDPGEVGDSPFYDRYYDGVVNLDLNGSFAFNDRTRLFFEANNLLNQPLRYYQGKASRIMQDEYYDWRFTAGFKYDL